MSPRVSVVIPAYKAAETICRAVDSVLTQSEPAHEIIIVDDGSPDNQVEVIERTYGDRLILIRQPNSKTAKARNAGMDRASGDFIAFLDADDFWEPHKLAQQLAVFKQHSEVGLVAGKSYDQQPGQMRASRPLRDVERLRYDQVLRPKGERVFQLATVTWTGTVIVRREVIGQERFVSGLEPAEDRDFWVRLIERAVAVYLISEPLATAVLEPGSISRSGIDRDCGNMLKVVERHAELLGRRGLKQWRSHTLFRWAANDPNPATAIPNLLRSFALWPRPFGSDVGCLPLGRTKRLLLMLAHWGQRKPVNELAKDVEQSVGYRCERSDPAALNQAGNR